MMKICNNSDKYFIWKPCNGWINDIQMAFATNNITAIDNSTNIQLIIIYNTTYFKLDIPFM